MAHNSLSVSKTARHICTKSGTSNVHDFGEALLFFFNTVLKQHHLVDLFPVSKESVTILVSTCALVIAMSYLHRKSANKIRHFFSDLSSDSVLVPIVDVSQSHLILVHWKCVSYCRL